MDYNSQTQLLETMTLNCDYSKVFVRQPTINVGMIGHVAHGKSTLVEALSSVKTAKHCEEQSKNMTMRLGYANVKIWCCDKCPKPRCYSATGSKETKPECGHCTSPLRLEKHISFVDCPGHELLIATMLNGSAVMDAALLLIAANEPCPQLQTQEHLQALELKGLNKFCVIQNKVDLVDAKKANDSYLKIREYASTKAQSLLNSPVIPVSAQHRLNLEYVCQYLANLPVPERELKEPLMVVIRSFDINKPALEIDKLHGGVAGGSLTRGILSVGQKIEVRPGLVYSKSDGVTVCKPLFSKVVSISSEQTKLDYAIPGGLIGVETALDPSLTKSDLLVGQMIGVPGHMPPVFQTLIITYEKIQAISDDTVDTVDTVPVATTATTTTTTTTTTTAASNNKRGRNKAQPQQKRNPNALEAGKELRINVNSLTTTGKVSAVHEQDKKFLAKIKLNLPCCAEYGQKITFSEMSGGKWKIVGVGTILKESQPLKIDQ